MRCAGRWVDPLCETIIPNRWPPVEALCGELGFSVAGEVAQLDESTVGGVEKRLLELWGWYDGVCRGER